MSELLIQRLINREALFEKLSFAKDQAKIIYTIDQDFITHMYDVRNILDESDLNDYIHENQKYFKSEKMVNDVRDAFRDKKEVVNKIFQGERFKLDLNDFLSEKKNNELRSDCIWNVTLFYNQVYQLWYRPIENTFFGFLNQNLDQLHQNIERFVEIYLINQQVKSEMEFSYSFSEFSQNELDKLNCRNHSVSIGGRLDFYNPKTSQLFEIKASGLNECSQEWILQTITYASQLEIENLDVKEMLIVNVLQGKFERNLIH